ncbi:ATP-dependent protease [bacterium (candidate division B38) B3_B38]|nr:MAG: ATP-dependent protease [bacterium (candidate division B38) B3_B38]
MSEKKIFKGLSPDELRWRLDPATLPFKTTEEVEVCKEIIGQPRALSAIRVGLEIKSLGYNIFVTGLAGTGRTTTIKCLLEEIDRKKSIPNDLCYVNNFKNPDMPRILSLPAGKGSALKKDMDQLIESLQKSIPRVFESESYHDKKKETVESLREKQKKLMKHLEEKVKSEGFTLMQIQFGPYIKHDLVPLVEGKPINMEQLAELVSQGKYPAKEFAQLKEKHSALVGELEAAFKKGREIERKITTALKNLDREVVFPLIDESIQVIKERHPYPKVSEYLAEVRESLLENLDLFRAKEEEKGAPLAGLLPIAQADVFLEYRVNLIVDNKETKGAPVIIEHSPNYKNLFGTVERVFDRSGLWRTDFSRIKAGSLLRANGGYLLLNARDALLELGVWSALKRTLKTSKVEIQAYDPFYMLTTSALKPEPIEVDLKVVIIGDDYLYHLLYNYEEDFKKIFKIKADFDVVMKKNKENIAKYVSFIAKICQVDKLKPFDRTGVAAVAEYGVRLAGNKKKLSTEFNKIVDIIREANYWAVKDNSPHVKEKHVDKAIKEKIYRLNMIEDKIKELIREGVIMIDITGEKVGQVNGLSILMMGDYSFGRPSKITAETSLGRSGVINIEREADLSGKTHNKGVLILSGYLRGKYAQEKPLSMSTSICFEQSYSGVEGDSASSTEVYAILSGLSGLPLRQDIAVTGSVNQKGDIQAIGGVNQKIEGFYELCKFRGLDGNHGVVIPESNVKNLMLKEEVVEAIKEGKFHIYPVKSIDQGIEILTGMKAGKKKEDGTYDKGTLNYLVNERLRELAKKLKEFGIREEEVSPPKGKKPKPC